MASGEFSFIDIAALDPVREKFARGASVIVVTIDLATTIWANGPGAALFGHDDVESAIGAMPGFNNLARRQIMALPNFPDIRDNTNLAVRIGSGLKNRLIVMQASRLTLPDGEGAIILSESPAASERSPEARAKNAISGFTRTGHHAAFLDRSGNVLAHTEDFSSLDLPPEILADLVKNVSEEADRIVKKLVPVPGGQAPAGIVRLTDDPASHLLVIVADADALETTREMTEIESAQTSGSDKVSADASPSRHLQRDTEIQAHPRTKSPPLPAMENAVTPAVENESDRLDAAQSGKLAEKTSDQRGMAETGRVTREGKAGLQESRPIRFVWKTDVDARIIEISDEFTAAFGDKTGAVTGLTFAEIATGLGLDPEGEIAALLKRRDTWSGRSIFWPISDTDIQVPVDLAALPVYDRERAFKGFRGFGVARMNEARPDPAKRGQTFEGFGAAVAETRLDAGDREKPAQKLETIQREPIESTRPAIAANDDPFQGEVPAINVEETPSRREADKIINLQQRRRPGPDDLSEKLAQSGLSDVERSAFRQIADRLRRETEEVPSTPQPFGKRKHPVGEPGETDQEPLSQARDTISEESGAGDTGVPAPEEIHARPASPAPQLLPNPVPSAFAGISRLFRLNMADHSVLMQLPVPIMIYNDTGIRFANNALLKLTGYPDVETLNRDGGVDALFPQHLTSSEMGEEESDSPMNAVHREGRLIPIEAHLHSVDWEGQKSLALSIRVPQGDHAASAAESDVEGDLQMRVDELVSILDTATDGVVTIAPDMTIRSVNRSAEALFGHDGEEIIGTPFSELFALESRQIANDYVSGLSGDGVASLLNDGREVIGLESHGRFIPLFMTVGKLAGSAGYCAVLRDITQWKQAESELTEARRLAEKSSSQKTEFLARISHEIRTPLNAIIGFSELILDEKFGPVGNERYRDYLKDINRSGNHVLDLVNDLLDISKIEAGEMELDYEAVSLNDALAEAIAMMQPQANRERVIVRSSLASNLPEVVADLRSVRQIAINLLSNAIRYTLAGGQVIVSTTYEKDGAVALRVRDTGVGMTQAEIGQALKPFRQISALKRKHDRGTGLGLPLTKAMVEANRAGFSINSTPGEGTLVEVVFPPTRVLAD